MEEQVCGDMKKITLEKLLNVLKNEENEVKVSTEVSGQAMLALTRMLTLAE